jgi:hypothetical protein
MAYQHPGPIDTSPRGHLMNEPNAMAVRDAEAQRTLRYRGVGKHSLHHPADSQVRPSFPGARPVRP